MVAKFAELSNFVITHIHVWCHSYYSDVATSLIDSSLLPCMVSKKTQTPSPLSSIPGIISPLSVGWSHTNTALLSVGWSHTNTALLSVGTLSKGHFLWHQDTSYPTLSHRLLCLCGSYLHWELEKVKYCRMWSTYLQLTVYLALFLNSPLSLSASCSKTVYLMH